MSSEAEQFVADYDEVLDSDMRTWIEENPGHTRDQYLVALYECVCKLHDKRLEVPGGDPPLEPPPPPPA